MRFGSLTISLESYNINATVSIICLLYFYFANWVDYMHIGCEFIMGMCETAV